MIDPKGLQPWAELQWDGREELWLPAGMGSKQLDLLEDANVQEVHGFVSRGYHCHDTRHPQISQCSLS